MLFKALCCRHRHAFIRTLLIMTSNPVRDGMRSSRTNRKTIFLAMKLTTIILLTACLAASAHGYSQRVTLSERNSTLEQVFKKIKIQTGYRFLYRSDWMVNAKPVDIVINDGPLQEALDLCFKDQPFTYAIVDQVVIVKQKGTETYYYNINSDAPPPIDVKGRIVNEDGDPVAGATVQIKGTQRGAITDADGNFILRGVDETVVLVISGANIENFEWRIKGQANVGTLTAKIKISSMQEVVLNKGYYKTTQRYNTGDVTRVDGKDLAKQPVTDPILALKGLVAGLEIAQTSGAPGSNSIVRLRGQNSIPTGKPITANDPLYIVDGIPFSSQTLTSSYIGGGIFTPNGIYSAAGLGISPFNSLNPADIESIEVLKDADATAIYGSQGANGVILLTTKKGKPGKLKADINVSSGVSGVIRYWDLLNTQQYLAMRREALKNGGLLQNLTASNAASYPDLLIWDTTRYTNWQKVFLDKSTTFTNANANISGGNANTQFLMGVGYADQGATLPGDYHDKRASMHASLTNTSANKRFQAQLSVNYSNDNSNMPRIDPSQYILLAPDAPPVYDASGNLNWALYNGTNTWNNPFSYTLSKMEAITEYYAGNLNLSYHILKGLDLKSSFGYSHSQMNQTALSPSTASAPQYQNDPNSRASSFSTTNSRSWIIEPQLTYGSKLWRKGRFDFLVGTTFRSTSADSKGFFAYGFASDALLTNLGAASTVTIAGSSESEYKYNAIFSRAGFTWDDKYLINLTARRDGSSRFGPGRQFGNFGAAGAGWIFSDEKWMQKLLPVLSFGKLRASYGVTGNDGIGDYQFLSTYSPISSPNPLSYQGTSGLRPTLLPNPDFRWEEVKKLEAGLELGFFKDRYNLSASWYRNRTDNQLVSYPLPIITGFSSVTANLPALIQNTGWEFTLHTTNIRTKDFTWSSLANLAIPRNKLVSFPGIENTSYGSTYVVGYSLSAKPVFHYTGVDPQTGLYQFATKDGTGGNPRNTAPIDPKTDKIIISRPVTQSFFGGLSNTLSYKGVELDFFIQFVKQLGYNYLRSGGQLLPPGLVGSQLANQPVEVLNRWQNPGDVSSIQQFALTSTTTLPFSNLVLSDGVITDASFIRLKSLSISYTLPGGWIRKAHLNSTRVYLQCQNLFTLSKYRGLDPESQGRNLPPVRTITAGINLSL